MSESWVSGDAGSSVVEVVGSGAPDRVVAGGSVVVVPAGGSVVVVVVPAGGSVVVAPVGGSMVDVVGGSVDVVDVAGGPVVVVVVPAGGTVVDVVGGPVVVVGGPVVVVGGPVVVVVVVVGGGGSIPTQLVPSFFAVLAELATRRTVTVPAVRSMVGTRTSYTPWPLLAAKNTSPSWLHAAPNPDRGIALLEPSAVVAASSQEPGESS